MYVQHSVHIDSPIEVVTAAFIRDPHRWLPHLDGGRVEVGPRVAGVAIQKKVIIEVGAPLAAGSWTEVPITWSATYIKRLFPVMTGKVELAPVDARVTRLTVCGMYQPPLGRLGKHFDDALMHRVADATVKELAEAIADRLVAECAEGLVEAD
ncbi:MAG: hypothetical protein QOG08_971 [Chloroflexota bacterium]|nr:hypothetical protein [Chloroflexota bacterium]